MAARTITKRRKTTRAAARPSSRRKPAASTPKVSAILRVTIWVNPRDGKIRVVAPGQFISSVTNRPGKRLHKHLYSKLKAVLKKRGKWFEYA